MDGSTVHDRVTFLIHPDMEKGYEYLCVGNPYQLHSNIINGDLTDMQIDTPLTFINASIYLKPSVEVKNVKKTYKIGKVHVQALKGVTFQVLKGEFVAIF